MEKIKELEISEMKEISGGSKLAYMLGQAVGLAARRAWDIIGVAAALL